MTDSFQSSLFNVTALVLSASMRSQIFESQKGFLCIENIAIDRWRDCGHEVLSFKSRFSSPFCDLLRSNGNCIHRRTWQARALQTALELLVSSNKNWQSYLTEIWLYFYFAVSFAHKPFQLLQPHYPSVGFGDRGNQRRLTKSRVMSRSTETAIHDNSG